MSRAGHPSVARALRVVVAGGGTGGHLFPGIAVAQELVARVGAVVSFVGSEHGIEKTAVPRAGFSVELLPVRGLRREGVGALIRTAWLVPVSVARARRLLRAAGADLVIGVGGYAAFPAVTAALLCRIPVVLLEQNADPGLVTRLLARWARVVCVSFSATAARLGRARVVVTGNPIRSRPTGVAGRSSLGAAEEATGVVPAPGAGTPAPAAPAPASSGLRLLVFGGSAGARRLNEVVPEALAKLSPAPQIVHQTGAADCERVAARYRDLGLTARVVAFIDDMPAAYAAADLVICRAGATTLAELTAIGLPAVLVPFPFAAGDHQRANALALVDAGAAEMILDRELAPEALAATVAALRDDPEKRLRMAEAARALGRPDATRRVADECLRAVGAPIGEPSRTDSPTDGGGGASHANSRGAARTAGR